MRALDINVRDLLWTTYKSIPEIRRAGTYMTTVFRKCYDY